MNLFNNIRNSVKAKNGFYYDNPYNTIQGVANVPLHTGLGYLQGLQFGQGLGYDNRSQKKLGYMSAFNNLLNSSATVINGARSNKRQEELFDEEYLDDFYHTPHDKYTYESYSNSPYYARKGGKFVLKDSFKKKKQNGGVIGASSQYIFNPGTIKQGNAFRGVSDSNHLGVLNREYFPTPQHINGNRSEHVYETIHGKANYYQDGGFIPTTSKGLLEYPGQVVKVPSNNITMEDINHPVYAIPDNDNPIVMKPGKKYKFPNSTEVIEVPLGSMQDGGVFDSTFNSSGNSENKEDQLVFDSTFKKPYTPEIDSIDPVFNYQDNSFSDFMADNSEIDKLENEMIDFIDLDVDSNTNYKLPVNFNNEFFTSKDPLKLKTMSKRHITKGDIIRQGLLNRKFSKEEANVIIGNIEGESAFDHRNIQPSTKAYGLMQWLGSRRKKLFNEYGNNPTLEQQLDYIEWELKGGNKYETSKFKKAMERQSFEDKVIGFAEEVERPSKKELYTNTDRKGNRKESSAERRIRVSSYYKNNF